MLTERALYERKWKHFPELAKLLDQKQLGVNWTGPSSVSDNILDQVPRILEIFALVQDNESEIERAVMGIGDPIRRDLLKLSDALTWASDKFAEASKISSRLANRG
jgi:hypothetical protein